MYRCTRCERDFERYEEYYKVKGEDVAFCENCRDDVVNSEFCEILGIDIIVCEADEEYERDFEED